MQGQHGTVGRQGSKGNLCFLVFGLMTVNFPFLLHFYNIAHVAMEGLVSFWGRLDRAIDGWMDGRMDGWVYHRSRALGKACFF